MKFLIRFILVLIFVATAAISYLYIKKSLTYNYKEPNIEQIMQAKLKNGYLDREIQKAIANKNFADVATYQKLADRFGIELLPKTKKLIEQESTFTKKAKRGITHFVKGFLSGKANDGVEVAGAITSDFTIYGDLRDITIQGQKYIKHEPYDKLVLGLSMAGIALTASQFATLGASSGLKVGTSTLKLAKREKMLTKGFGDTLHKAINKSVNFKALKSIKFGSIKELKNSSKLLKSSVNLKPLKPILKDLHTIEKSTSIADSVHLLKYIDNTKDLKSVAKLSKRYKGATKGIFKLLGKNAFRLVKVGVKWTTSLIYGVAGLILSVLGFLFSFFRLFKN